MTRLREDQGQECVAAQAIHGPLQRPNGWRLGGDGGEADGVRCSRGLGRCPEPGPSLQPAVVRNDVRLAIEVPPR
jgi:hypothetical protein